MLRTILALPVEPTGKHVTIRLTAETASENKFLMDSIPEFLSGGRPMLPFPIRRTAEQDGRCPGGPVDGPRTGVTMAATEGILKSTGRLASAGSADPGCGGTRTTWPGGDAGRCGDQRTRRATHSRELGLSPPGARRAGGQHVVLFHSQSHQSAAEDTTVSLASEAIRIPAFLGA